MDNFNLHTPIRILFGKGTIAGLREQIPHDARVLITYGSGSAKKIGVLDQVLDALKGMDVLEFGDIGSNPAYGVLMNAVKLVRERKVTFLLAVGGGSVLDGIEFIATTTSYPESVSPWHILQTGGKEIKDTIPMGCVLTLPATGSESNTDAVISRKATGNRQAFHSTHVQPISAVLDPVYTYTLPSRQVANGVVDAFVHTVEQYVTKPADAKIQDCFAEGILLTLIEDGPKALKEPENCDVRANIIWAATQTLNGLIGAGVPQDWATHMLGHGLTAIHGLDHAQILAVVLSALQNEKRDTKRVKLLQYTGRVWNITEGSDGERIDATIAATHNFFGQLGVPTHLSDYGLDGSSIPVLLEELKEHGMIQLGGNHDATLDVSRRIYEAARQVFYTSNFCLRAFRPDLSSQHLVGACSNEFI